MVFSSLEFLLIFLPFALLLYFATPAGMARNIVLLVLSLVFYAWGEPVYVVLMCVAIVVNWVCALLVDRSHRTGGTGKLHLVLAIVFDLAIIGFFKYEGFLATNVNALLGSTIVPILDLPLPIGISFFSLQALSYVVDVYRKRSEPQRNIILFALYIATFAQLTAGPIVRYHTVEQQLRERTVTLHDFACGLRLFVIGLAKKVLLSNVVAIPAGDLLAQGGATVGAVGAWVGLIAFTFQIYFDFSGYSDMAIGLGRMLGFHYEKNFNYPYIATTLGEFWRRWHISLSSFFRDYVYIPLGGNRVSKPRWVMNILIVWMLTGLWHGAAWNFIFWGLFYGIMLLAERLFLGKFLERIPRFFQHLYAVFFFTLSWGLFWITDPAALLTWFKALFGVYGALSTSTFFEVGGWQYLPVFIICAIASTPIMPWLKERLRTWAHKGGPASEKVAGAATDATTRGADAASDATTRGADGAAGTSLSPWAVKSLATDDLCVMPLDGATPGRRNVEMAVSVGCDIMLLGLLVLSVFSVVSGSYSPFMYFGF